MPEGTEFTVTKAEADQYGYTTTPVGDRRTIVAGTTVEALCLPPGLE